MGRLSENDMLHFKRSTEDWKRPSETLKREASNNISVSAAEVGAKAITNGCMERVYATNLLEKLSGETRNVELWTSSSSARAISQRLGPQRRANYLEVQTMWEQSVSKQSILKVL